MAHITGVKHRESLAKTRLQIDLLKDECRITDQIAKSESWQGQVSYYNLKKAIREWRRKVNEL